jgi:hypothetical protein
MGRLYKNYISGIKKPLGMYVGVADSDRNRDLKVWTSFIFSGRLLRMR